MSIQWRRVDELPAELRQRWAASRVWAAHQAPYLATAVLALDPVVVQVDGGSPPWDLRGFPADRAWHVYLDPDVLAAADPPGVGFWLLHQVTHLLRRHADRFPCGQGQPAGPAPPSSQTPEQRRWNAATDAEINDDLHAGEVAVPAAAVTPARLFLPDGWTAEQYWDALGGGAPTAKAPTDSTPTAGAPTNSPPTNSPPANSDQAGRAAADDVLAAWDDRADVIPADGIPPDLVDCGSGCDGQQRPWDCGRPGLSELGQRMLDRDVARRIQEHQKRRGDVPEGWQRWADDVLSPVVNWRRQLAAAVRRGVADTAGRVDFTYRRPSRRAAATPDVVLPSLRQPLPQVAMVLDTSGSMSDGMLAQALGEVGGVLRSLGLGRRNLRVICCDAQAYGHQRVLDAREVKLLGGGGTDMGAGLTAAADLRPRPDLCIVLTDGHTPWPQRAPDRMRVVVGLMDAGGHTPDWATTVLVDAEATGGLR
jgi:predicted metal-dependent peptidase